MGLPRAHVFSRLMGALPMFTRLCTAGACSCVCHGHMCFRVCGCLAHVHTLVHSRCMVLCVCVPRAHVFQRLWVLGPCSHVCAQQVHVYGCAASTCDSTFVGAGPIFTRLCTAGACSCVCHEHMRCSVCGCLAHVHTFVHGRCMFLFVFKEHL